jgi:integrase
LCFIGIRLHAQESLALTEEARAKTESRSKFKGRIQLDSTGGPDFDVPSKALSRGDLPKWNESPLFISSLGLIRASFQFLNLNSKRKGILMIVRFNPCSEDLQRLQFGPIGPHLRGFAALVTKQNYCNVTGWLKVRLVAKFSRWLQRHRITLKELNEAGIDRFLHARWKRLARHVGDRITMDLLLRYLREVNATPPKPVSDGSDIDLLRLDYQNFLLEERSLFPSTSEVYLKIARRFLVQRFPSGKIYLKSLEAKDVVDFVLHDTSRRGRRTAQLMATVLRSFFAFLFQKGRIRKNLSAAVPTVPNRRLADIPHYLEARDIEKVLRSCDRRRSNGKRNYAIFLLLARLGLRAGEVVQLTLDDN